MRRRALLSASALSLASLAGCVQTVQRRVRGPIQISHAAAGLHPASEPWIRGGLSIESGGQYRTGLVTERPSDDTTLFADAYAGTDDPFGGFFADVDYASGFLLVFEMRSSPDDAHLLRPTRTGLHADLQWAGIDGISLPLERYPYDSDLSESTAAADELVCTLLAWYAVRSNPTRATVRIYDDRGSPRSGSLTARRRFR